ncbi:transcriptional regulator [Streptomyces sp. NPDC018693]|uniref:transcriptional regulator n=1 Tax=unclassified Streptomyces TaxID=2593676 RepID=UPI0037A8A7A4
MTRAAAPPPLPVRDRSRARDRAGGGLSPMLTRLAAERASGVLEREHGTLHLANGRVVHAESPFAPGLGALLLAHGTLDPDVWRQALDGVGAGGEHAAVRRLLDTGRVARGLLELCHLGALYDAGFFALAPSSTPGRFRYDAVFPADALRPVAVAALERETLRRRALLHGLWPRPCTDTAPLLRTDAAPPSPPPETGTAASPAALAPPAAPARPPRTEAAGVPAALHRRSAVLALVDGRRTASDIARRLGRRAFPVLADVRRLAAAGLVTPKPEPPPPTPPTPPTSPVPPTPPTSPALHPPPALRLSSAPSPSPAPPPAALWPSGGLPPVDDPDITLLKRLRDALEAL